MASAVVNHFRSATKRKGQRCIHLHHRGGDRDIACRLREVTVDTVRQVLAPVDVGPDDGFIALQCGLHRIRGKGIGKPELARQDIRADERETGAHAAQR